jgi:hypothetical protein
VKNIIAKNRYLSAYATEGAFNDMDMLEIGRGLTPVEEETHFGMWCIMSSPLLIGCDLTTISEASLRLLKNKELIALNQDRLGLQAYVALRQGEGYVLVKDNYVDGYVPWPYTTLRTRYAVFMFLWKRLNWQVRSRCATWCGRGNCRPYKGCFAKRCLPTVY